MRLEIGRTRPGSAVALRFAIRGHRDAYPEIGPRVAGLHGASFSRVQRFGKARPWTAHLALSWRAFFGRGMPPRLPSYRQDTRLAGRSTVGPRVRSPAFGHKKSWM
jgi:hypothetical protein